MNDGDALLAAIIANPEEDTPRLMYADWLTEQGQHDRAEFIRVQCGLANSDPFAPSTKAMLEREERLWSQPDPWGRLNIPDACRWQIGIIDPDSFGRDPDGHNHLLVRRGFVKSVRCTAADWLAHGTAIRVSHPATQVTLTTWPQGGDLWRKCEAELRSWLGSHFPGVAFHLPQTPPTWTRVVLRPFASAAEFATLAAVSGRVNSAPFMGRGVRELQLVNVAGEQQGDGWRVAYHFRNAPPGVAGFPNATVYGEHDFNEFFQSPAVELWAGSSYHHG